MRNIQIKNANDILHKIIKEEQEYYYSHIGNYDDSRVINIIFADDILKTSLEYDFCEVQKKVIEKEGEAFKRRNGTVLLAREKNKPTLILISKSKLIGKEISECRGTLIHELTHAYDYYDYADYLGIEDYNLLFTSEFYRAFYYWTEYNARKNGYKRFLEYKYIKSHKQLMENIDYWFKNAKANFSQRIENREEVLLYEVMQAVGRYSRLSNWNGKKFNDFSGDMLRGILSENKIIILQEIYNYLITNLNFIDFNETLPEFEFLLRKFDKLIKQDI